MSWRSAGMSRLTRNRWSGLVVGVILVAALTGINILLDPRVPAQYVLVLYVLPVKQDVRRRQDLREGDPATVCLRTLL